jgi:hypothetical protein
MHPAYRALAILILLAGCDDVKLDARAFEAIHRNIYEVYGLTDPDRIFDTLSSSLYGPELEKQIYEYMKCLKVQEAFNTEISIAEVIYNDVRVLGIENEAVSVYCKWIVIGKVRHPTHIHRKTNLNEAVYRVALKEGGPRIVGFDPLTNQELEVTNR